MQLTLFHTSDKLSVLNEKLQTLYKRFKFFGRVAIDKIKSLSLNLTKFQ